MQRVVLTVSNGRHTWKVLEYTREPRRGEAPFECLTAFRGAVFLTGCSIRSARVVEQENGAVWIAPPDLIDALNDSLADRRGRLLARRPQSKQPAMRSECLSGEFLNHMNHL